MEKIMENSMENNEENNAENNEEVNMDLLTNRLVMLTGQITLKHMNDLREKERIDLKRVRDYKQSMRKIRETKVYTFAAVTTDTKIRKTKFGNAVCKQKRMQVEEEKKME